MKLSRTLNAKRNMLYGLINRMIIIFMPFVIRTILIRYIGIEYAGLNSLFSSILQVLNLAELGFSSAVVYSMYKPIAERNDKLICELLNYYRKAYFIIGIIILCAGSLLIPFLPNLIEGSYPDNINIYVLYIIYLLNTCISYLFFGYKNSLLNAYQRNDVLSNISSVTQGGLYLCQIIILVVTKNYYLFIIFMPIFTMINNILVLLITNKMYPQYQCKGVIDYAERKQIREKVSGLFISKICFISRNAFDSIFISTYLGLTITAIYGNYYLIMNSVIGIISVITLSMLAGIGNSIQTETIEKNYEDLKKFNFMYMCLSGWCTVCMVCLYQPFMKVWAGNKNLFDMKVVALFCIYFYVLKMGDIRSLYVEATGLWWENRFRSIAEAVLNLILNYLLVQIWGIYGIIIATLISLFFINFIAGSHIVFKHYFKNKKTMEYFGLHFKYFIVTFLVSIISWYICSFIDLNEYLNIVFKGIVATIVTALMYLLIYHRSEEYKKSVVWIKNNVLRKKRK